MISNKVDWNKFYGEVCPVCKKPVMSQEWIREPFFCSAGYLREHGYRVDRHSKYVLLEQNYKRQKFYPVHRDCSIGLNPSSWSHMFDPKN